MKNIPILPFTLSSALMVTSASAVILVDYDDGIAGNGIHDTEVLSGGFTGATDGDFTPYVSLNTGTPQFRTNNTSPSPGNSAGTNFVGTLDRTIGLETGYTIQAGDLFDIEFSWRSAANWDANDEVVMSIFFTADNDISSTAVQTLTLASGGFTESGIYEREQVSDLAFTNPAAVGQLLFVSIGTPAVTQGQFTRIDDLFVEVKPVPEPSSTALIGLAGLGFILRRRR